jgi:hypothetical protein
MTGQWPSGWDDPEDEVLDTEEPDEETEVRLSQVAAFLATVPAPVLPGTLESRIVAALAAESAARAADFTADSATRSPEQDRSRTLGPAPARARVRRFRGLRPAQVSGALVACLLFVGLGFAISLYHGPSSSSSAASAPAAASATAGGEKGYSSQGDGAAGPSVLAGSPVIVVIQSGMTYRGTTLTGQVRSAIHTLRGDRLIPGPAAVPSASASSSSASASSTAAPASSAASSAASAESSAASAPSESAANVLRGCVLNLTGGAAPRLVDRASYQGTPAYVIATASHVWVVGLDCTAARPDLITSASLPS